MQTNIPYPLSYSQCLLLIQEHFRELDQEKGAFKNWCLTHELDYMACRKITKNVLRSSMSNMVHKLLTLLGYQVSRFEQDTSSIDVDRLINDGVLIGEDIFIVQKVSPSGAG